MARPVLRLELKCVPDPSESSGERLIRGIKVTYLRDEDTERQKAQGFRLQRHRDLDGFVTVSATKTQKNLPSFRELGSDGRYSELSFSLLLTRCLHTGPLGYAELGRLPGWTAGSPDDERAINANRRALHRMIAVGDPGIVYVQQTKPAQIHFYEHVEVSPPAGPDAARLVQEWMTGKPTAQEPTPPPSTMSAPMSQRRAPDPSLEMEEEHPPDDLPDDCFRLGSLRTNWITLDCGDGTKTYTPKSLRCVFDNRTVVRPPEIMALREEKLRWIKESKRRPGRERIWNGKMYAVEAFSASPTASKRHLAMTLVLRPHDYATFLATVASLPKCEDLRRFIDRDPREGPVVAFANGLGISLVVRTRPDNQLIFARRAKVSVRQDELDVSVIEGLNRDRDGKGGAPNVFLGVVNGAKEELGITLRESDIKILGFGVDVQYYQWQFIAYTETGMTFDEVCAARGRLASMRRESHRLLSVPAEPEAAFRFLRQEFEAGRPLWSIACVATYWAFIHMQGGDPRAVAEADRRMTAVMRPPIARSARNSSTADPTAQ